ncbi:DMT family transporter [Rhodovulum sp. YNF3179]|uniref:DMT family transporter n=1 Tax=Rhodovulum sp. YNF3179 TaxID=3425127 RepID=UPI003D337379
MQDSDDGRPLLAALHILGAVTLLGLVDNTVRLIAAEAGLWQFHLTRSAMVAVVLAAGAAALGWRLRPRRWRPVLWRSVFLSGAMVLYFAALAMMPIAEVGAGLFTAPIFVLLISVFAFGRRIGRWRVLAVAVGFAGVLLVLRPQAGGFSALTLLPVAAGFLYALQALVTRRHCASESTMCLQAGFFAGLAVWAVLGLAVVHLVLPAPGTAFFDRGWVPATPAFLFWTGVQAVGSLLALGLLTRGYQLADPSYLAVFEYVFLVSAGGWAWVLWGEVLPPTAYLGIALIAVAGIVIGLRSRDPGAARRQAVQP